MVNYPHKIRPQIQKHTSQTKAVDFANRGMSFEKMINETNQYYLSRGLAVIHKKPTPIQIVRVDYPQRSRAKIVEAYFRQASTTDYSGVYQGHYIDFEAKETRQKHSMPMKNFHVHQIEHMEQVLAQKGICFVLLHFSSLKETYLLPASYLIAFFKIDQGGKSMPLTYIQEHGYLIAPAAFPSIPYLDIIKENLLGGKHDS
ncbi:Holliday junction resolvase RecU [Streptococcus himalayensis]|uniref:Holliday junction resolvase RecU n=1 Tax=Streptococcus himalayensis TaxID=1888195 RepID=A0A917A900_9STRE|nr:Holliday junction resolvase RecU [Streptococcus himalayensis]GGE35794.1 Holliday junction resolvase RecU [Streptococcus himalayensis]